MPRRRLQGYEPHAVASVRQGYLSGLTERQVLADLRGQHPELPDSTLRGIAARESERWDRLRTLGEIPWGQFADIPRRLGCPGGTSGYRASITVHWSDPETGLPRRYNATVETGTHRTVRDLMADLIGSVLTHARGQGYQPRLGALSSASIMGSVHVHYVDCL